MTEKQTSSYVPVLIYPPEILRRLRRSIFAKTTKESESKLVDDDNANNKNAAPNISETVEDAIKRITRFSYLGRPDAKSVMEHPLYDGDINEHPERAKSPSATHPQDGRYIAAITTEPPNAHVDTFTGRLTLPSLEEHSDGNHCHSIALDAENMLLRGSVLRNTEWAIGLAVFTGEDTKLAQNQVGLVNKISELDKLVNRAVLGVLCGMIILVAVLAAFAVFMTRSQFDQLFYCAFNTDASEPWPYLPNLDPPVWNSVEERWIQNFFTFITLLSGMIPISMYVCIEFNIACSLYTISTDLDMYDDTADVRAKARNTNVSDLGRIQYIFSDKTGTLTQNVMVLKRCSVDGMAFGKPIQKACPQGISDDDVEPPTSFLPMRHLLVGQSRRQRGSSGTEKTSMKSSYNPKLTFNAEMFLRVMSLCHTVVVEQHVDERKDKNVSNETLSTGLNQSIRNGPDGAPYGFAYQAESPDEGALVSAASNFDFQVVERDADGIHLRTRHPSHFNDRVVVAGLKKGTLSLKQLAAKSASVFDGENLKELSFIADDDSYQKPIKETWKILAVNKFDSDRKRMSILLRSPPEMGSLPILFVKGADSAMLDPKITQSSGFLKHAEVAERHASALSTFAEEVPGSSDDKGVDPDGWEVANMLGIEAHLGEFAKEGLRTLVLGIRILSEEQCKEWLKQYRKAETAIEGRNQLMSEAAAAIECNIFIVGATAIEDKLQRGVPETIATLGEAGIKLWVLTGDKRETAVEIGYSTNVLTPNMHLIQVPDNEEDHVRAQISMEFIRLTKNRKTSTVSDECCRGIEFKII